MAKRNIGEHPHYELLENCYHQGLLTEAKYNILYKAMQEDTVRVTAGKVSRMPPKVEWNIEIVASFDRP